jgi:hypothetical protein
MGILALSGIVLAFAGLAHLDYRPKSTLWSALLPAVLLLGFGTLAILGQKWAENPWLVAVATVVIGGVYNIKLTYKVRPSRSKKPQG